MGQTQTPFDHGAIFTQTAGKLRRDAPANAGRVAVAGDPRAKLRPGATLSDVGVSEQIAFFVRSRKLSRISTRTGDFLL